MSGRAVQWGFFCLALQLFVCQLFQLRNGLYLSEAKLQEAADGSVCFDNCNGHGECVDYACICHQGYHGDSCSTSFAREGKEIIQILGAGHFNMTKKSFAQTLAKHKLIVVGFSSHDCHKCIAMENEYDAISKALLDLKIPFGRANAHKLKTIASDAGVAELPALVMYQRSRPVLFKGYQNVDAGNWNPVL